jgi:hypothetical protein
MSNYTPAPWEVSSGGDVWPVNGNPRVKICTVTKPSPANGINWQANAYLIAESPNLLLTLREAVNTLYALRDHAKSKGDDLAGIVEQNAIDKIIIAINRAEGKS